MKKKFLKYFIMCTAVIFFMSSVAKASTIPVWSNTEVNEFNTDSVLTSASLDSSETLDSSEAVTDNPLKLESSGAILIEQNTGKVLYDHNMHEKLRPASVTKVMSLLLIMEALNSGRISLTDKVPCSENASSMGGSQIWLETSEELTVDEMLKAICIVSANDCVVAMAEFLEGSEEAFVAKMNEKAQELAMNDTTFMNCHGIDEDGHLTSAYDIAIMSRELLVKHPSITNYTTIYMDSLRDGKSELVNTNKLVRNYEGCTGLKTGSTSLALFNLSASATRNDLSLIAVVMHAETSSLRFSEAKKLLDYGYANYQYKNLGNANDVVGNITVDKGISGTVNAILQNGIGVIMKKSNDTNISQTLELYNNVYAPVTKGQKIGELVVTLDNEEVARVDVVAENDVAKYGFSSMTKKVLKNWFSLIRS